MSGRRARGPLAAAGCAGLAVAVAVTVTMSAAGPAGAAEAEDYPRPADQVWSIAGKGYGHGRGMSQWGAQGAARQGRTARQILAFYYPGTAHTTIPAAPIRVQLRRDEGRDTAVGAQPLLGVRDAASGRLYRLPAGPARWRAVPQAGGGMRIDARTGSTWTRWTAPDGRRGWTGPLRFGVADTTVLTLYVGETAVRYRGKLTAVRTGATAVATVNTVPMDAYLYSVVPAESPPSWRAAALQAQAVAARTYAAYGRARNAAAGWDTCDTTACQVYGGVAREAPSTTAAVRATANQVRTLAGAPILAEFSASNGGWTVAGSLPYQVAKADPYDVAGGTNPVFTWTGTLTAGALHDRYPQVGLPRRLQVLGRDGHGRWGGRLTRVRLVGSAGSVELTGSALREGLRSTWWVPRPTVSAPARAPLGAVVPLTGTARVGATVEVWFRRGGTAAFHGRTLVADGAGRWATTFRNVEDTSYYAIAYGVRSLAGQTLVER